MTPREPISHGQPVVTPRERPILFSGEMVRAILDGRKTQTRRMMNPQPRFGRYGNGTVIGKHPGQLGAGDYCVWTPRTGTQKGETIPLTETCLYRVLRACPYGAPGDRLWVRETWGWSPLASMPPSPDYQQFLVYAADDPTVGYEFRARPSIHMPRWACRIVLELTDVRVERLQDISRMDALAEGWTPDERQAEQVAQVRDGGCCDETIDDASLEWYADLWESINGKGSWDANPWVWVLSFRRCCAAGDQKVSPNTIAP